MEHKRHEATRHPYRRARHEAHHDGHVSADSLERQFHEAMLDLYKRARIEAHYDGRWFLQMVGDHRGMETAKRLVLSREPAEGYLKLWEQGRLDLTVEYLVLQPPWPQLFDEAMLQAARDRLRQYGMDT